MKKEIAFFDFDGTITTKDTLLEFIKFVRGKPGFYTGFLLTAPWLVAFKLKIISNQRAKERVLRYFFKGVTVEQFNQWGNEFASKRVPQLVRPKAIEEIKTLKERGVTVIIVSASPENWIMPWANGLGIQVISTRMETKDGRLTGKIRDINCHGDEKVKQIHAHFNLNEYATIMAYGDSSGDKPMLALANEPHYKPFR